MRILKLIFIFNALTLGASAFAMRYDDYRRSDDIDDRRQQDDTYTPSGFYPGEVDAAKAALVSAGRAAKEHHYAFSCSNLKPTIEDFKRLGSDIEKGDRPIDDAADLRKRLMASHSLLSNGLGCYRLTTKIIDKLTTYVLSSGLGVKSAAGSNVASQPAGDRQPAGDASK